jgi:hypothetical protein
MIQWRNLNFDPIRYWDAMEQQGGADSERLGMPTLLETVHEAFPALKFGYFNPPKEKFRLNKPLNS